MHRRRRAADRRHGRGGGRRELQQRLESGTGAGRGRGQGRVPSDGHRGRRVSGQHGADAAVGTGRVVHETGQVTGVRVLSGNGPRRGRSVVPVVVVVVMVSSDGGLRGGRMVCARDVQAQRF